MHIFDSATHIVTHTADQCELTGQWTLYCNICLPHE